MTRFHAMYQKIMKISDFVIECMQKKSLKNIQASHNRMKINKISVVNFDFIAEMLDLSRILLFVLVE